MLKDFKLLDTNLALGSPSTPQKFSLATVTGKANFVVSPATPPDTGYTNLAAFQAAWDGAYTTFQEGSTYTTAPPNGSLASSEADVADWVPGEFPVGTPLDPWNHPYGLAYSIGYATAEEVMVIYSAGPDGKFQTEAGAVVVGDSDLDGSPNYATSDDLLYKFK